MVPSLVKELCICFRFRDLHVYRRTGVTYATLRFNSLPLAVLPKVPAIDNLHSLAKVAPAPDMLGLGLGKLAPWGKATH